jgi:hypothetical protein
VKAVNERLSDMSQDFESWLMQIVADDEDDTGVVDPNWRLWLQALFEEWGALPVADVEELMETEEHRLQEVQRDAARRLLPAVIADGHAAGMTLDVVLMWIPEHGGHLEVLASPEPGSRHYQTSSGDALELFLTDAERLAWLADEVQEATMERDQVHCFVWPTCPVHQLGGHAVVEQGTAVWRCNGGGGHVLARIGELGNVSLAAR